MATGLTMKLPSYMTSYFANLSEHEVRDILTSPKIVNVCQGCSVGCDFCAMAASSKVRVMPWPWVVEIANKIWSFSDAGLHSYPWAGGRKAITEPKNYVSCLFYDSDPLRDYYDAEFDKDFADVYSLFNPTYVSTAGFEMDTIGERAAAKLFRYTRAQLKTRKGIRVSFTLESQWAQSIDRDDLVRHMKNVFSILQPDEITILTTNKNQAETLDCFAAAYGRPATEVASVSICQPHFEGRAKVKLAKNEIYYQDAGSVCCADVAILNPNGSIIQAKRNQKTGERDHVRKMIRAVSSTFVEAIQSIG